MKSPKRFDLDFAFLFSDTFRLMRRTFRQRMSDSGLTFDQIRVLMAVSFCEGIRQADLADILEVQPITLVRQLDQLAALGLIERRTDSTDRRAYQLFLTQASSPHLSDIKKVIDEVRADMLRGISKEEVALTYKTMGDIRSNLSSCCSVNESSHGKDL